MSKTLFLGGQLVHDIRGLKNKNHRTDHIIHHLSFGDEFPGQINPLDNSEVSFLLFNQRFFNQEIFQHIHKEANLAWHYYLKVVPTEFRSLNGSRVKTNQYSVTRHEKQIHPLSDRLPGVFISVSSRISHQVT